MFVLFALVAVVVVGDLLVTDKVAVVQAWDGKIIYEYCLVKAIPLL
jgi:hypothetical protein